MIKERKRFFSSILFLIDLFIVSLAWIASYYLRFYGKLIPVHHIPSFSLYLKYLIAILLVWMVVLRFFNLYQPRKAISLLSEGISIIKASSFLFLLLICLTFFLERQAISRITLVFFWILGNLALFFSHLLYRELWKWLWRKGYNIQRVLIIGAGSLAVEVRRRLESHPELGFRVVGFLTEGYEEIGKAIKERNIDSIFIALPLDEYKTIKMVLQNVEDEVVDIRLALDIYQLTTLRGGVEEFDGLSFITLQDTPIYGWNAVLKRCFDILFSLIFLILSSFIFLLISFVVKLSSKGPLFYKQERMGLDGRCFEMLKFRTMKEDAEKDTGPIWAKKDDLRRTRIGAFLRRASLDELPQLFNVLKGEMSLVGPRPERPVFVEEFRKKIPKYILRHKMKAGITGWAQVNGLRGNTSLEKRIEYDLYYIEHWSLLFDLNILFSTLGELLFSKHAY